ncbi:MAG TPA: site-specific integrase [Methylomirabilota bacterium]|nr:site-specific integrase [Methylomirabilota bacterium]
MARKVADRKLDSKAERNKLKTSPRPYYREIGRGLHLGFRKGKRGGTWVARMYAGNQTYKVESIAHADDDHTDANGETVLTYHQAVDKARELQATRTTGGGDVTGPYTVRRAVDDYLTAGAGKASNRDARTRADALILPELGNVDVSMLTASRIRKWLADLASAAPRSRGRIGETETRYRDFDTDDPEAVRRRKATANRTLTILKAALNFAFREGKAASDREWRRVEPFEDVDAARARYLTVAEAKRLINGSDKEFRPLVQAALETGCRYGELTRLKVEDFNPDVGTLAVRQSKSGKPRHVVLTDEGQAFFAEIVAGRAAGETMFRKATGNEWRKSHQARPMVEACKRAKIKPAVGFHVLRHTWTSHAVMAAVPLLVVAKNLGHADTRMVERHYGHLAPSYIADAIRAGAPRFGFKPGNVKPMPARA